jgi:hypothetical protein
MASHWRAWRRGGPVVRSAGRCALPGWQSALLYATCLGAFWAVLAMVIIPTGSVATREEAEKVAWLALLALGALAFPPVLQSFVRAVPIPAAGLYFIGLGVPLFLALVAAGLAESRWHFTALRQLMELVPVSSFIFSVTKSEAVPLLARVVAAAMLATAFWQARPYWARVASYDGRGSPAGTPGAETT